ncbi:MAG: hypothetical protein IPG59_15370 [Candidatus Melainabacteria bacterium]|nr:MAG: hypothetical protein IPG59_15370 [Candidatus Melainabacteria bacterium]
MFYSYKKLVLFCTAIIFFLLYSLAAQAKGAIASFPNKVNLTVQRSESIEYDINLATSPYFIFLPSNYTGREAFGLIAYTSASEQFSELPPEWEQVLARNKLILICPQNAGNECGSHRRHGLTVLGTLAASQYYNIDKKRIYAAGFSGGARIASNVAFLQPDLYCGTIQSCGTNFYKNVPRQYAAESVDTRQNKYGVVQVPANLVQLAKSKIRFALITGSNDFRYGNIKDIFQNGFYKEGFKVKMFDIPGMQHTDCDGNSLDQAVRFVDGK